MKTIQKSNYFTEWFIALRYLFSKKSHSIINIISIVTLVAISVPTAAMIIIMSVYNGLDGVLKSLYSSFDPQISITLNEGKFFDVESVNLDSIRAIDGVLNVAQILDDNAMVDYRGRQTIATVRGVDDNYRMMINLDTLVSIGGSELELGDFDYAIPGMGVAYDLGVNLALYEPLNLYVPKSAASGFLGASFYSSQSVKPNGIFVLDEETDAKYIITSLRFAEKLFDAENRVSQIGVELKNESDEKSVMQKIESIVGDSFSVKNRFQQKEFIFNVMSAEKRGVFLLILMILIVASFTLVGTIIMLITDKQSSNFALQAMGATDGFIKNIFIYQGVLITIFGVLIGSIFGIGLVLLQANFGLISIDSQTMLIDSYPVELRFMDIVTIVAVVLGVNGVISYVTTNLAIFKQ